MNYRLGFDLGSTSIGWAVLKLNNEKKIIEVINMGSRIFSDGRDAKSKEPLNVTRRNHRGARRNRDRKLKRKKELLTALYKHQLMTKDKDKLKELILKDPYFLRKKGLTEKLTLHELGRALFHLNQKRGFKSFRKYDNQEAENSNMKIAMKEFKENLSKSNSESVGEYFYHKLGDNGDVE